VTWVTFGLKLDIEAFEAVFRFPRPSKIGGTSENKDQVDFFGIRLAEKWPGEQLES
jgi:hypothetical protein